MKVLSIIIVNWNTTDYLIKCLEGIFEKPPETSIEVIVVDNNSDDDARRITDRFPEVRFVSCAHNYGFAVGNNIGYRLSTGKYVMALNPDTIISGGTIDGLVQAMDSDESVGVAVPVMTDRLATADQYSFFNIFVDSVVLRKLRGPLTSPAGTGSTEPFDVEFISGTGYICRAPALEKDRFFSEDNFLFGEEYYLCRRMKDGGFKIRVVPSARFEHYISVTFKDDPDRAAMASYLGAAVMWKIRKEHWGNLAGAVVSSFLCLEYALKWALLAVGKPVLAMNKRSYARMRKQSRAIGLSIFPLLLNCDKHLAKANQKAARFFNGGCNPVYPPIFEEIR